MCPGNPFGGRAIIAAVVLVICSVGVAAAATIRVHASQIGKDLGAFHADCAFSHRAPDDAIVHPGRPGRSHLHDFAGSTATNAFSTNASLRAGGTNCHRPADKSAYWFPTLYKNENREAITPFSVGAYYTAGKRDFASIQPFPADLKMIAGEPSAKENQVGRVVDWRCTPGTTLAQGTSPENSARARALRAAVRRFDRTVRRSRRALKRAARSIRRQRLAIRRQLAAGRSAERERRLLARSNRAYRRHRRALRVARAARANRRHALRLYLIGGGTSIPTCRPEGRLELHVRFPDCWDGRHQDSGDHKSHMAYSRESKPAGGWVCPSSHSVLVPRVELTVRYPTAGGPDIRLSPGDVDSGHADFMNGWDQTRLAELVRNCLNVDKYCGGGDIPAHQPSPTPEPSPAPSPSPIPLPLP